MAYDLDSLLADVTDAHHDGVAAVCEIVERALKIAADASTLLGPPIRAGLTSLLSTPELTVLRLVWGPNMSLPPHNHNMWAVVGIESGREWNRFFRLESGVIRSSGEKELFSGEVISLGRSAIHSVTNPLGQYSSAVHVYGGDFFATPRTEWDEESGVGGPSSGALMQERFDAANGAARTL